MEKLEKLQYINANMPGLLNAFFILSIKEVKELEINFYYNSDKNEIQFHRESYDSTSMSAYIGPVFFTDNDELLNKVFKYTKLLAKSIDEKITEKISNLTFIQESIKV